MRMVYCNRAWKHHDEVSTSLFRRLCYITYVICPIFVSKHCLQFLSTFIQISLIWILINMHGLFNLISFSFFIYNSNNIMFLILNLWMLFRRKLSQLTSFTAFGLTTPSKFRLNVQIRSWQKRKMPKGSTQPVHIAPKQYLFEHHGLADALARNCVRSPTYWEHFEKASRARAQQLS